jgi:hypothetical protein
LFSTRLSVDAGAHRHPDEIGALGLAEMLREEAHQLASPDGAVLDRETGLRVAGVRHGVIQRQEPSPNLPAANPVAGPPVPM